MFSSHSPKVGKSFVGSQMAGRALPIDSSPSSATTPSAIDVLGVRQCAAVAMSGGVLGGGKPKLALDLFSGTGSVGRALSNLGYKVVAENRPPQP